MRRDLCLAYDSDTSRHCMLDWREGQQRGGCGAAMRGGAVVLKGASWGTGSSGDTDEVGVTGGEGESVRGV